MSENNRERGRVKFFVDERGYGFIERDGAEDLFFHYSEILGQEDQPRRGFPKPWGQHIEFEVGDGLKGPCAKKVIEVSA